MLEESDIIIIKDLILMKRTHSQKQKSIPFSIDLRDLEEEKKEHNAP